MNKSDRYNHILPYHRIGVPDNIPTSCGCGTLCTMYRQTREYGYSFALSRLPNGRGYG